MAQPGQMQARGEFGQGLDLKEVQERPDGFTFVCPAFQQLTIQLRKEDKVIFNNELVKTSAITAEFRDYRFFTKSAEVAELVRKTRAFERGTIKELGKAKEDASELRKRQVREALAADPELAEAIYREAAPITAAKAEAKAPEFVKPAKK